MKFFYNIRLEDNYKLHIIDSDINIEELDKENYIVLKNDNYIIKGN